ncbi:unnamed protein product [Brachionus calyciflorus]|uniref:RNA helicase n=1 Tax=Brachionus calyciflorus TaxID=104777 RepID=A0A813TC68_9BILA|nr:unnamed protein product [Brachionus calyciflorus]
MNRSSNGNYQSRGSYGASNPSNGNYRSGDRRSDNRENYNSGGFNHSNQNRQKQLNSLDDIKNLPKPNWSSVHLKHFEKKFLHESQAAVHRPFSEVTNFLTSNNISVSGAHHVKPVLSFNELEIPKDILYKIQDLKFDRPTPIQSMCWPSLLNGNDMVGIARTGSGKTFGFILPMLIHIMNNQKYAKSFSREEIPGPVGLVVAPTRELAMQIQQVADDFGNQLGIKNIVIYGGSPKNAQLNQVRRGADIYIATPGRLIDFVKENQISLSRCTFLVLDEADRMLDMGFEPQIRKIIEQIRPDRQTAMFSATWPKEVRKLAEDFISNYCHINIGSGELAANPNIKQIVEVCQEYEKEGRLREILTQIMSQRDSKAIVFAETKKKVDMYSKIIQSLGHHCLAIHGDKKQQEREWVLNEFKRKPKSILCATDVAARGLNISDIKYVINIDYPMQTEDYVHRIGRTARNSNTGTAFTFITGENAKHVPKLIEILRGANQQVSDSLLALTRNGQGFRSNGFNRNQRPSYNNNNSDGYNQNGSSNGYKRSAAALDESSSSYDNGNDTNKRVRRNRWDDGTSNNNDTENGYRKNGNGYNDNYQLPPPPQVTQQMPTQVSPPSLLAGPGMYSSYASYY